jgi:hypothetical protein
MTSLCKAILWREMTTDHPPTRTLSIMLFKIESFSWRSQSLQDFQVTISIRYVSGVEEGERIRW